MQTLGQHAPPIDKRTETPRASQAVKHTLRCTTLPKGKTPAQQAEGRHRKATAHRAKRLHSSQDAAPPTSKRPKNMPEPHAPARSSHARKPTPKPTKAKEPTQPKPKPTKKPRPVHPKINPGQPTRPNHADPSEPPPPDRTETQTRNQNANWNHPGPNDVHPHPRPTAHLHPRRKPTPTPTFEQLPEHIRH
ncbi:hypothetical protein AMECASPLE_026237 [Ameca splendens]|uniref:Uncharacterized protein n=1 Tax=Ameca splendens TaxID=208324 RepID=A0ABV0YGA9_9TELE